MLGREHIVTKAGWNVATGKGVVAQLKSDLHRVPIDSHDATLATQRDVYQIVKGTVDGSVSVVPVTSWTTLS